MTHSFNIAICSNSETSVKKLIDYLEEKNYSVFFVKIENELIHSLKTEAIHLVFLELDLKHKDGISLVSDIRSIKDIEQPYLIVFSNKSDEYIQITAFNAGADDFIVTPIKPILVEAKIASIKKRIKDQVSSQKLKSNSSSFFVDKEQYLIITKNSKITLPRKEFEMLYLMCQHNNKVFTRHDFAKLIWNSPEVANSRTIDIHIRNIRKAIGNAIIKTVKGIGYRFDQDALK